MPTPEEILREQARKKRQPIGQTGLVQPVAQPDVQPTEQPDIVGQMNEANNAYAENISNAYSDLASQNAAILAEQQKANEQRERSFAQMMLDTRADYEKRMAENEQEIEGAKEATRFAGATKLAASLVNLAGVAGIGSANQSYKDYSVDWMKRVDSNKDYARKYKDAMRDKLNQLNLQLDALKAGNVQSVLNLKGQGAKEALGGRLAEAQARQAGTQAAINMEYKIGRDAVEDAQRERQMDISEENAKSQRALTADAHAIQRAQYGLVPDGKGGYKYNPEADPRIKLAQEREMAKITAKQTKAGAGGSANNLITLAVDNDNGTGDKYVVEPKSLAATIYVNSPSTKTGRANRKGLSQNVDEDLQLPRIELKKEEQSVLLQVGNGTLKGMEATIALTPILKNHPELKEPVKQISQSYSTWAYTNGFEIPDHNAQIGNEVTTTDFDDEPVTTPKDTTAVKKSKTGLEAFK